jgi:polysaccharide biosynthesis transport protein
MPEQFSVKDVLGVLRTRALTIVLVTTVAVATAIGVTSFQPRQYDATATLLTGQGEGIGSIESVLAINQTAQALGSLATDRVVVAAAVREAGLDEPVDSVLARVSAEVPSNTPVIRLTVRDTSPQRAATLANAIVRGFADLIEERAGADSNLSAIVWQDAVAPTEPSAPNVVRLALVALVLGLLLGTGIAFLREHLDGQWRSELDVERALGLPVLGTIPVQPTRRRRRMRAHA